MKKNCEAYSRKHLRYCTKKAFYEPTDKDPRHLCRFHEHFAVKQGLRTRRDDDSSTAQHKMKHDKRSFKRLSKVDVLIEETKNQAPWDRNFQAA